MFLSAIVVALSETRLKRMADVEVIVRRARTHEGQTGKVGNHIVNAKNETKKEEKLLFFTIDTMGILPFSLQQQGLCSKLNRIIVKSVFSLIIAYGHVS